MSQPDSTESLTKQLVALLRGGQAHATLDDAVGGFPESHRGTAPQGSPYSAWQLLEHLRITQRDILDFSAPGPEGYKPLAWPKEYWPPNAETPSLAAWDQTLGAIREDAERFIDLLQKPDVDLYTPFAWGDGQNLLREALLIADHNSYHLGELVLLRRVLGIWKS